MFKNIKTFNRRLFSLFFIALLFLYSLQVFSKTIVISDIDDTLKKANSMGKPAAQAYHFLRKVPYFEMRDLFLEIKAKARVQNEEIKFYYVSAAYSITFNAQEWISKYHFPEGHSVLKTLKTKAPTYEFKHKTIKGILDAEIAKLSDGEPLNVYMFGDNAQVDQIVYSDLTREMNLNSEIFIRDVRGEATFFNSALPIKKLPGVNYYFSEMELFVLPTFNFISSELRLKTFNAYKKRELIPVYTFKTLERRLIEILGGDKKRAQDEAEKYWNDYYSRF